MASVLFIYGTTGGNTELAVWKVAEILQAKKHKVCLHRAECSKISDIKDCDICILASPTYGQGVLIADFMPFAKALEKSDMKDKKFAVIGLGDPKYHIYYHLESVPILERIVEKAGGILISPPLMVSGPPVRHLDGLVKAWAEKLSGIIT